jgi:hypothetical protein
VKFQNGDPCSIAAFGLFRSDMLGAGHRRAPSLHRTRFAGSTRQKSERPRKNPSFWLGHFHMASLRVTRVETFFGELEYLETRLKALGVNV